MAVTASKSRPKVSESFARNSEKVWEGKQDFRYDKVRFYRHESKRPSAERKKLEEKWLKSAHEADGMIRKRRAEIKWYEDHKPRPKPSSRSKAVAQAKGYARIGVKESPSGSNSGPYITTWQKNCAGGGSWLYRAPWCGVFCWNMLDQAGVKNLTGRMASVAFIEDDARAGRHCYSKWTTSKKDVRRGDLVVLFGRGIHVEMVTSVTSEGVWTVGGNTSGGASGSQANGGGVYVRFRPNNAIHGFAIIDFPNS